MSQNNPLTSLLETQPFIVLDGAMATELEARGCHLADSLWIGTPLPLDEAALPDEETEPEGVGTINTIPGSAPDLQP